jgi:flagellar motility protein MotE (MotC chaperone)
VPSVAFALWLMVAAGGPTDPLAPPPHGREVVAADAPSAPTVSSPSAKKPADVKSPRAPSVPVAAKTASPSGPTKTSANPVQEPEEEVVVDAKGKMKLRTIGRPARKTAVAERDDVPERKNPWSTERYAAVVPPGLTLAALRSQLNKGSATTADALPAAERPAAQSLSDIEKAREALRQETARLEALIKVAGNCSGSGGVGMPMGDSVMPTPVSQAAIREAAAGEQMDSVSKAMKGMKPEQAAAVIARLDRTLAAEILRRMKASDAGAILGLLKPELAA